MTILNALLMDSMIRHPDGRVDLVGLFEDIHFPSLPATYESISLFVDIVFANDERGLRKSIDLVLRAPDGGEAHRTTVKFEIPTAAHYPRDTAQLDLTLFHPTLTHYGNHVIEISEEGRVLRSVALRVLPIPG
ncbi:MAG: DUF6941 family protein [Armatimonadota bacterium]